MIRIEPAGQRDRTILQVSMRRSIRPRISDTPTSDTELPIANPDTRPTVMPPRTALNKHGSEFCPESDCWDYDYLDFGGAVNHTDSFC